MRMGPESVCESLERTMTKTTDLVETGELFLSEHESRMESFHNSAYVISIRTEGFPVLIAVSPSGKVIVARTISDPFDTTPSPYRLNPNLEDLKNSIGEEMNVISAKGGVFEFPPNTKFLAVVGDDLWISKISFRERIKGIRRLTFAQLVDEELYRKLSDLNGSTIDDVVYITVNDEFVDLIVLTPEDVPEGDIALLAEMARVIRDRMGLKPSGVKRAPDKRRVLQVFRVDLEDVISGRLDVRSLAKEFVNRLNRGYISFLKGADLI